MSSTMTVTVTQVSPSLLVKVDGADTACPAEKTSEVGTLIVGDRVRIEKRDPLQPLVTGKVSA